MALGADHADGASRPGAGGLGPKDHVCRGVHIEVAIHAHAGGGIHRAPQRGIAGDQDLTGGAGAALGTGLTLEALRPLRPGGAVDAIHTRDALGALAALDTLPALGADDRHRATGPHAGGLGSEQHVGRGVHIEVTVHADPGRGIRTARQRGTARHQGLAIRALHALHALHTLGALRSRSTRETGHTLRARAPRCAPRSCGSSGTGGPGHALHTLHARRTLEALEARPALRPGRTLGAHQVDARHRPDAGGLGAIEEVVGGVDVEVAVHTQARPRRRGAIQHGLARDERLTSGTGITLGAGGTREAHGPLGSDGADGARGAHGTRGTGRSRHTLGTRRALSSRRAHGTDHAHGTRWPRTGSLGAKDHVRGRVHVEVAAHTHTGAGVHGARQGGVAGDQDLPRLTGVALGARSSRHALRTLGARRAVHAVAARHALRALGTLRAGLALGADHADGATGPHAGGLGSKDHIRGGVHIEVAIHAHGVRGVGGARERRTTGNQDLAVAAVHALHALDALGTLRAGVARRTRRALAARGTRAARGSGHTLQALRPGGAGQARGAHFTL